MLQISEVPSLTRIVVVWNHQLVPPPHVESWPKISKPLKVETIITDQWRAVLKYQNYLGRGSIFFLKHALIPALPVERRPKLHDH